MATRKFSVTHPDGSVSKRTSKSRTYAFAIVSVPATDRARHRALNKQAYVLEARAAQFEAAADAGAVIRRDRGMGIAPFEFHAFDVALKGTEVRGQRVTYCEINDRSNDENLTETWREFVPDGVEIVRETEADYSGEMKVAVDARAYLVGKARRRAVELREQAARLRTEADTPDTGGYDVLRWSSRRDLAEKALAEFAYATQSGRTLQVVPVDD